MYLAGAKVGGMYTGLFVQLMQSAAELHHARHVQKNILSTVEALGLCVPGNTHAVLI